MSFVYNQATFLAVLVQDRERFAALHEEGDIFMDVIYDKHGNFVMTELNVPPGTKIFS